MLPEIPENAKLSWLFQPDDCAALPKNRDRRGLPMLSTSEYCDWECALGRPGRCWSALLLSTLCGRLSSENCELRGFTRKLFE